MADDPESRLYLDDAIIALLRAGRPDDAFAQLVPAYRRRVFGIAYGILRDSADAEDVAQEVFVKLWQGLGGYDGRAKLSTWIYAIARNASISAACAAPRCWRCTRCAARCSRTGWSASS